MAFTDKQITCVDCGKEFTFTAAEQEFFSTKGYTNEPKRCLACRQSRKAEKGGGSGSGARSMQKFPAVCAQCGKETEVPFEPRQGRPVYCSTCYSSMRQNQS